MSAAQRQALRKAQWLKERQLQSIIESLQSQDLLVRETNLEENKVDISVKTLRKFLPEWVAGTCACIGERDDIFVSLETPHP
eukprot:6468023-Amphidinium_carterae.1